MRLHLLGSLGLRLRLPGRQVPFPSVIESLVSPIRTALAPCAASTLDMAIAEGLNFAMPSWWSWAESNRRLTLINFTICKRFGIATTIFTAGRRKPFGDLDGFHHGCRLAPAYTNLQRTHGAGHSKARAHQSACVMAIPYGDESGSSDESQSPSLWSENPDYLTIRWQ